VSGDTVPVAVDHLGELLVGIEALPLERRPPVLEEPTSPAFLLVVPELTERLLEQVRDVESLVGGQERLEGPSSGLERSRITRPPRSSGGRC
jgi:hypothetical protein